MGGTITKLAHKKHIQEVFNFVNSKDEEGIQALFHPRIVFSSSDLEGVILGHNDHMIISVMMVNADLKRVFVDQGSSIDIIFRDAFDKFGLTNSDLQTYKELLSFSEEKVHPNGYVTFYLILGTRPTTRTVKVDFLVVDCPSAYNVILGRPILNKIEAVISIACLTMKFFTNKGEITMIRMNQAMTRRCYNASLEIQRRKKEEFGNGSLPPSSSKIMMVDLDV